MSRRFALLSTHHYPLLTYQLEALARHGAAPAALILDSRELSATDAQRLAARTDGAFAERALHQWARAVPVYLVESHNDEATLEILEMLTPDFIVNGGTPRVLGRRILSSSTLGILNCHPGRLPEYRGCTCPEWAIFNGDPVCSTVHRMSERIDEGPVLMIEAVPMTLPCSYQEMRIAVYRHGLDLLARASRRLQSGELNEADFSPQRDGTYYKPIDDAGMEVVIRKLHHGITPERHV